MAQISLRVDDDVKRGAEQTRFTLKAIWHTCGVVLSPLMQEKA